MVEERATEDDAFRRSLEKKGRPLLSHGRDMSDDQLLGKLRSLGFDAERERLLDLFPRFVSAQAMAEAMFDETKIDIPASQEDWVWIAITCLWERWQPELPNMEMVDDSMQAGYAALKARDTLQACRLWLQTWRAILDIMDRGGIRSLDDFDDRFGGTQSVFNWVQDLEMELHNAGLQDAQFFHERIMLCETMIGRFSEGSLPIDSFKTALGESYFKLGDREKGDHLFRTWLDEQPRWVWGWIGWSDCYWPFPANEDQDAERAERILKEGLASPGVEDRAQILERLAQLYEETGRDEQAEAVREEIEQVRGPERTTTGSLDPRSVQIRKTYDLGHEGLPLEQLPDLATSLKSNGSPRAHSSDQQPGVGRNKPCPCGSGRKYKKCCGKPGGSGRSL
jgi:hypothetical protein